MDIFVHLLPNNRELAVIVWISFLAIFLAFRTNLRRTLYPLWASITQPALVSLLGIYTLWVLILVVSLWCLGIWETQDLKGTLLWFVLSGSAAIYDSIATSETKGSLFRTWLADNFKALVVVEFVAHAYSFPLVWELLLFPFLVLLTAMAVVGEKNPDHARVVTLAYSLLALVLVAYLGYSVWMMVTDFSQFETDRPVASFLLPPILSLGLIPLLYVLHIYARYELMWVRIARGVKDVRLAKYSKWAAAIHFRTDLEGLRRWGRKLAIANPSSKEEIRDSIRAVKTTLKRERKGDYPEPSQGWLPLAAVCFLEHEGLKTTDYHETFDGEWWAESASVEVDRNLVPSTIVYRIFGSELEVTTLLVKLHSSDDGDDSVAMSALRRIASTLTESAVGTEYVQALLESLANPSDNEWIQNSYTFISEMSAHKNGRGYDLSIRIEHSDTT